MKIIRSIYWYAYQSELDKGGGTDARKSGTLMATALLVMWIFSIGFLAVSLGLGDLLMEGLKSVFGYSTGKTVGRVLGSVLFLIIYPVVHYTVGSKASYNRLVAAYLSMEKAPRDEQAAKGMVALILSVAVFVISIIIGGIASM